MVVFGIPNVTFLRAIDFFRSSNAKLPYAFNIFFLCSWLASRFLLFNSICFFELIHHLIQSLVRWRFFLLDINFATYAALRQPISVLHTTTQIEPSGELSTSCRALIKTGRQLFQSHPLPSARARDSSPAWTSPQRLKVTHLRFPCQQWAPPLFKLSLILQHLF